MDFDAASTQVIASPDLEQIVRNNIRLTVVDGPDRNKVLECGDRVIQIGSQEGTSLQLKDEAISRIHLEIRNESGGLSVRDLGSTNGTWIDDLRIIETFIPSGTELRLGHSRIRIETLDSETTDTLSNQAGFGQLVGRSKAMRLVFAMLERVAPTDETILITGETGTGKELCAMSIAEASRRAGKPFVVVDCGALSPNLIESELFGHVRGAFTNAVSDYVGAFERANGGTLFLDEIGELPLEFQTRLLRVVENRTVRRIGGSKPIPLDIRIIAATNRSVEEEVNRGTFRADLYYRLSVVSVRLPALRERPEDIEHLARHIVSDLRLPLTLDAAALASLTRYRWPGNVRELRNHLRRLSFSGEGVTEPLTASTPLPDHEIDLSRSFREAKEDAMVVFEKAYISALLAKANGNISEAARIARTDRSHLSRLIQKYQLIKRS